MKSSLFVFSATLFCALMSVVGVAECAAPSSPGAVICYPSPNSTFTYPLSVEAAATGESAAPITKMVLYADNQKIYETDHYSTMTTQSNGAIQYNGWHHLVLNAWDANGHLFQYSEYVNMLGGGVPQCASPGNGISLCSPQNGQYLPDSAIEVVASGAPDVSSYDVYLNGKFLLNYVGRNLYAGIGTGTVTSKPLSLTLKAHSTSGKTYTVSRSFYQYYASNVCGKDACAPGINLVSPTHFEDVTSGFTLNAQVADNTSTIVAMKAYVDNGVVASSTGPSLYTRINAGHGTHFITVQAWDATGALYKTQETVNVQ